jgi:hypothetical protein
MDAGALLLAGVALLGLLAGVLLGAWLRSLIDADTIADLVRQLDECESGHHVQIDRILEHAHHQAYRAFTDTKPSGSAPLGP